jgi:hypothetical protein
MAGLLDEWIGDAFAPPIQKSTNPKIQKQLHGLSRRGNKSAGAARLKLLKEKILCQFV